LATEGRRLIFYQTLFGSLMDYEFREISQSVGNQIMGTVSVAGEREREKTLVCKQKWDIDSVEVVNKEGRPVV